MSETTPPPRRRPRKQAPAPIGHRMTVLNWLITKSTGDLLILFVASTVCIMVIGAGAAVVAIGLIRPEIDTSQVVGAISDVINTLIGLLAGFLAGRTDAQQAAHKILNEERESALRQSETKAHVMSNSKDG